MDAGLITVGDELLSGEVENSNATWLARRLAEQGVKLQEMRVVPDERDRIAEPVAGFATRFDVVVVTGGLGSTPDDMTLEAVAGALDVPLERNERALRDIERAVAEIQEEYPEFTFDSEAAAQFPEGGEVVPNDVGIAPGCVLENVYVLPGLPEEMRATFEAVDDRFDGDRLRRSLYTQVPESHLNRVLTEVTSEFEVSVGCYPQEECNRIRLAGSNHAVLDDAVAWVRDHPEFEACDPP
jgi:nicotinamide-nucleotide amidase